VVCLVVCVGKRWWIFVVYNGKYVYIKSWSDNWYVREDSVSTFSVVVLLNIKSTVEFPLLVWHVYAAGV
jgi:hypothetical protein